MAKGSLRITRRRAAALIAGGVCAPALIGRARAAEVTLKLHHMLPPVSPAHRDILAPWAKRVAEQSGGRIDVKVFAAMQLGGKPAQLIDQVRDGIADISWALPVYNPGRYPLAETATLPFMVTTAEATSVALDKFMAAYGGDEFADVHVLAFHVHAPGKFHMREKPIASAADLAGLRIRAPNQVFGRALGILGAEPVFFPVTEMAVGLANGVIDGTCLPYEVVPAFKLQELTKVHCEPQAGARGLYANSFVVPMNKARYEAMPDDLRAVIDANSGIELSRFMGRTFDVNEQAGYELCKAQGNSFVEIPRPEMERWREATRPVVEDWIRMLDDKGHPGAELVAALDGLITAASGG